MNPAQAAQFTLDVAQTIAIGALVWFAITTSGKLNWFTLWAHGVDDFLDATTEDDKTDDERSGSGETVRH